MDRDITVFIKYNPTKSRRVATNCQLEVMRFHKFNPSFSHKKTAMGLLKNIMKTCLRKKGQKVDHILERRRCCGSSGPLRYSKELLDMIATPNSTPKKGQAVFFLRGLDEKWHLIYNNTKECDPKSVYYTNPVRGGKFTMPSATMELYPLLYKFVSTKGYAALIVREVEQYLRVHHCINIRICPDAVDGEISNVEAARCYLQDCINIHHKTQRHPIHPFKLEKMYYQWYNEMFLNFTLILHPVGAHKDTFGGGDPSLENRVAFSVNPNPNDTDARLYVGTGRGGAGLNNYCWALFDWGTQRRAWRRVWTHPNNAHLPGSEQDLRHANNNNPVQCTLANWRAFYEANHNVFFVPPRMNPDNLVPPNDDDDDN